MKKFLFTFLITVTILFAAACTSNNYEYTQNQAILNELLYDFDYMFQLMEDSFPYFGTVYRLFGIDLHELAQHTRQVIVNYPYSMYDVAQKLGIAIENLPELDEHVFWSIITREFFAPLNTFAHMDAFAFGTYDLHRDIFTLGGMHVLSNARAIGNPNAPDFYRGQRLLFANRNSELFYFYFPPSLFEWNNEIEMPATALSAYHTQIIEEGRIALLTLNTFWLDSEAIRASLANFYENIQDYEHLIIDIRWNGGGSVDLWRGQIIYPLWYDRNNMPTLSHYAFFVDSELGRFFADAHIDSISHWNANYIAQSNEPLLIANITTENHLPYLNQLDIEKLAYGLKLNTYMDEVFVGSRMREHFPFAGQIWVLTSDVNVSASAAFARHAKETGFATLVGTPASGMYTSTFPALFSLPNTGIVLR